MGATRWIRRARNQVNKWIVQVQNSYLRNERVFGHPFQLTLEPTNHCNLRCPLCPTTFRESRLPSGRMSASDAKTILDRFPYTVQLVLSNWGEPFMNPEIFEIIADAKSRDIQVKLESNFTLFDEASCHALVDSRLDNLVVALDGASQESYEVYRVGGVFADVIENIETLRRVQAERGDFHVELEWKMVIHKHNEHEIGEARAWAERLGMSFNPVTIWTPADQEDQWLPKAPEHRGPRNGIGGPAKCHNLWQAVSVNFNGDVFPCCSEFAPSDRIVNVLEAPFEPNWNSDDYRARRRRNKGPVDCSLCHGDKDTNWYRTWMKEGEDEPPSNSDPVPKPEDSRIP